MKDMKVGDTVKHLKTGEKGTIVATSTEHGPGYVSVRWDASSDYGWPAFVHYIRDLVILSQQ